jgi:hypothetical protein
VRREKIKEEKEIKNEEEKISSLIFLIFPRKKSTYKGVRRK